MDVNDAAITEPEVLGIGQCGVRVVVHRSRDNVGRKEEDQDR
jgi:hypothetical protein